MGLVTPVLPKGEVPPPSEQPRYAYERGRWIPRGVYDRFVADYRTPYVRGSLNPWDEKATVLLRDAAAGFYFNSIFTDYPNVALHIEDLDGDAVDSRTRLEEGDLGFFDNLFFGFGAGSTIAEIVDGTFADATIAATNAYADPQLGGICRTPDACLDPRPAVSSPAASGADFSSAELGDWFDTVDYRGAFAPGAPVWATGWTALDTEGFLSGLATPNEGGAASAGFGLAPVYPNPARGTATVAFELDRPQVAMVAVYDVLGREVAVLARGEQPAGRTTLALDAAGLPAGLYVVRLAGEAATATQKVVVVR